MTGDKTIFRLVYVSQIAPAELPRLDQTLNDILESSRRLNGELGITGLLLVTKRHFMHALEGDQSAVQSIFAGVRRDPRNVTPEIAVMGLQAERSFREWSMCARSFGPADAAIIDQLEKRRGFDPGKLSAVALTGLLKAVAEAHQGPPDAVYV